MLQPSSYLIKTMSQAEACETVLNLVTEFIPGTRPLWTQMMIEVSKAPERYPAISDAAKEALLPVFKTIIDNIQDEIRSRSQGNDECAEELERIAQTLPDHPHLSDEFDAATEMLNESQNQTAELKKELAEFKADLARFMEATHVLSYGQNVYLSPPSQFDHQGLE